MTNVQKKLNELQSNIVSLKELQDRLAYNVNCISVTKNGITNTKKYISEISISIEKEVVFNTELKNEAQRKLALIEKLADHKKVLSFEADIKKFEKDLIEHELNYGLLKSEITFTQNMIELNKLELGFMKA